MPDSLPPELTRSWRIDVGIGHASPIVVDDRVFVFSHAGGREVLRALRLVDGHTIWSASYPVQYRPDPAAAGFGEGPRSTPTYADGRIVTFGISGILSSFDAEDGSLRWQHDFASIYPSTAPVYGVSMSPIVREGLAIAHIGGEDSGSLTALDARTGAYRWGLDRHAPGYASPVVLQLDDGAQLVTQSQEHVVAVDPGTGRLLWAMPFEVDYDQTIVTPLVVGNRVVLSGLDRGLFAVEPRQVDGRWEPVEVWRADDVPMYMSSPVLAEGRIFGMTHRRAGQYFAVDASDGSDVWKSEGREGENAALVVVGDRVLILDDEAELAVIAASANEWSPLATYRVAETPTWAHPVPTAAGVLIKDFEHLTLWSW